VSRQLGPQAAEEAELAGLAVALGARQVAGWSRFEDQLASRRAEATPERVDAVRRAILQGDDPLGDRLTAVRSPSHRRAVGATYTPSAIVRAMLDWAEGYALPTRVVDPGTGSGRFLVEAGRRFPEATLIGVERDPLPALLARANLAAHGLAGRSKVLVADYRSLPLEPVSGRTLFVGNPPYVRHHQIPPRWKTWLGCEAARQGLAASRLAGLHVYFYLATAARAVNGDFGTFITAAEWLDVNYGNLVRQLFLGALGGRRIVVIEPTALPFAETATTAVVASFGIGDRPATILVKRVQALDDPHAQEMEVSRDRLEAAARWSSLTRPARGPSRCVPSGLVELGELCRVHRGQVTGANKVWIAGGDIHDLPSSVLFPAVTRARELFEAGRSLHDPRALRRVIDLPVDLDRFQGSERRAIDRFLGRARLLGAHDGYIARNRRAWWSVGLREPAAILATYMARRPPAFVRNVSAVRHINIAHGLYPRAPLSDQVLARLTDYLATATLLDDGRTYSGGLTKFEPKEMERLLVPRPEDL
jgi:SAM-dependent methyltransferase